MKSYKYEPDQRGKCTVEMLENARKALRKLEAGDITGAMVGLEYLFSCFNDCCDEMEGGASEMLGQTKSELKHWQDA